MSRLGYPMSWRTDTNNRYWKGYPARYRRELRRNRLENLGCFITIMALLGYGTWFYGSWIREEVTVLTATGLLIFGVPFSWLLCLTVWGWLKPIFQDEELSIGAHVVPYFEEHLGLGRSDAPRSGFSLARNCEVLDEMAYRYGVSQLTDLGLDDDLGSQSPVWRSPEEGLLAVQTLLVALKEESDCGLLLDEKQEVITDLEKLESALLRAQKENVRYCLLVRKSSDTRVLPGGVDLNRGSFW